MVDDLVIRAEMIEDYSAVREVVAAAFDSDVQSTLVEDIRRSGQYIPALSLLAERIGRVIGHVMISHAWLEDGMDRRRIATLSPLAVAPADQRAGIGSALVRAVTRAADLRGEPLVVLEGSPAYYGRFGFEPAARHGISMTLPTWAPLEAAQVMKLSAYHPSLVGRVLYSRAFDAAVKHDH